MSISRYSTWQWTLLPRQAGCSSIRCVHSGSLKERSSPKGSKRPTASRKPKRKLGSRFCDDAAFVGTAISRFQLMSQQSLRPPAPPSLHIHEPIAVHSIVHIGAVMNLLIVQSSTEVPPATSCASMLANTVPI